MCWTLAGATCAAWPSCRTPARCIYADEETFEERLQRLLGKLDQLMSERQRILSTSDAKDFYDFNARFPERRMPAVVVVIDNFAELQENQETLVEMELMPLVRASLGAGISLCGFGQYPQQHAEQAAMPYSASV